MKPIKVEFWRSQSFVDSVWSDPQQRLKGGPEQREDYHCPEGVYLNYRQLMESDGAKDRLLATLTDQGHWRSKKSGQIYSDITISGQ